MSWRRATRAALAELLLTMADDEFVSGFTDSEWTGIAPLLEEDVAISSIAQDELGHARALYQLLADVVDDGRDEDALAYDREPDEYRHARLLDHARGDWADTIARRFLYELADEARLASIGPAYRPLADLVEKLKREERYHRMHVLAWIDRLARGGRGAAAPARGGARRPGDRRPDRVHAARRRGGAARGRHPDPVPGRRRGGVARRPDDDPRARSSWRSRRTSR